MMRYTRHTRRTISRRSWAETFGNLRELSILCTSKGTDPVPNFSTRRWLRKSSSLDKSRIFIIFVGRHVSGSWEVAPCVDEDGMLATKVENLKSSGDKASEEVTVWRQEEAVLDQNQNFPLCPNFGSKSQDRWCFAYNTTIHQCHLPLKAELLLSCFGFKL